MRKFSLLLYLTLSIILLSCQKNDEQTQTPMPTDGSRKGLVEEVLQANSYTYLKVTENGNQNWLAVAKQEIKTGTTVFYKADLEMNNFESKELNRTFDSIFFVSSFSDKPLTDKRSSMMSGSKGHKATEPKTKISVEQPKGSQSIAKLSADRAFYESKVVTIRGQVTKYNAGIINRNWVHIQDGTKDGQTYDLTITTDDVVSIDDIVTFKGKIVLNKDFGAGYKYDIIMEEATLQ